MQPIHGGRCDAVEGDDGIAFEQADVRGRAVRLEARDEDARFLRRCGGRARLCG